MRKLFAILLLLGGTALIVADLGRNGGSGGEAYRAPSADLARRSSRDEMSHQCRGVLGECRYWRAQTGTWPPGCADWLDFCATYRGASGDFGPGSDDGDPMPSGGSGLLPSEERAGLYVGLVANFLAILLFFSGRAPAHASSGRSRGR